MLLSSDTEVVGGGPRVHAGHDEVRLCRRPFEIGVTSNAEVLEGQDCASNPSFDADSLQSETAVRTSENWIDFQSPPRGHRIDCVAGDHGRSASFP